MSSKLKFAVATIASVVLAMVLYLMILLISHNNNHKWDLTENQRFSLSPQSIQVVRDLKAPVEALVFLAETDDMGRRKAEELLDNYKSADPQKFKYQIIDPKKSPGRAREHDVRMPGQIVLVAGKKTERASNVEEESITNALLKLSEIQQRKVYLLTGHGERTREGNDPTSLSNFVAAVTKEGYEVSELNLGRENKIPEDAAALLILGPESGMLPAEQETLKAYMAGGGHVVLMLTLESKDHYDWLLTAHGLSVPDQVILDRASQLYGAQPVYPVGLAYSPSSPIAKPFLAGQMNTIFGVSRPVDVAEKLPEGAEVQKIVQTGPEALTVAGEALSGRSDLKEVQALQTGTIPLVVSGTYKVAGEAPEPKEGDKPEDTRDKRETRLLVTGGVDFICNQMLELFGNRDLALNMVNWVAESEGRITIRPKDTKSQPLVLTQTQSSQMWLLLVVAIPLAVLLSGFLTAFRRR